MPFLDPKAVNFSFALYILLIKSSRRSMYGFLCFQIGPKILKFIHIKTQDCNRSDPDAPQTRLIWWFCNVPQICTSSVIALQNIALSRI